MNGVSAALGALTADRTVARPRQGGQRVTAGSDGTGLGRICPQ